MRLIINLISLIFYPKTGVFHPKMAQKRAKTGEFGLISVLPRAPSARCGQLHCRLLIT